MRLKPRERHFKGTKHAALVYAEYLPPWQSARIIRENIIAAYKILDPSIQTISYEHSTTDVREKIFEAVLRNGLRKLIFVDPSTHPLGFIKNLELFPHTVEEYCFHIYGNFSILTPEWVDTFNDVRSKRIKILVASAAQKRQLITLLGSSNRKCVQVVPFPAERAAPDSPIHADVDKLRSQMKISKEDFSLVYAGRISPDKNVDTLLEFTRRFGQNHPRLASHLKLVIAGAFDNLNINDRQHETKAPDYKAWWRGWYKELPPELKAKITLTGHLARKELDDLYQASDLFVSLSTFSYEDFGLAPIEALLTGCPALLSAWGGFLDFSIKGGSVRHVPLKMRGYSRQLSYAAFEKGLLYFMELKRNKRRRKKTARIYRNRFGPLAISKNYAKILKARFTPLFFPMKRLTLHAKRVTHYRESNQEVRAFVPGTRGFWKDIYTSYSNKN